MKKEKWILSDKQEKECFLRQDSFSWTASAQVLYSWTALAHAWTCLHSDFESNFVLTLDRSGLQDDD